MNKQVKGFELKISERKRGGWKEHIPFTEDFRKFMNTLNEIIDKHDPEEWGKYKASYIVNGGYGKNKETGSTIIINWDGELRKIYSILLFNDPHEDGDDSK